LLTISDHSIIIHIGMKEATNCLCSASRSGFSDVTILMIVASSRLLFFHLQPFCLERWTSRNSLASTNRRPKIRKGISCIVTVMTGRRLRSKRFTIRFHLLIRISLEAEELMNSVTDVYAFFSGSSTRVEAFLTAHVAPSYS
jgi:hypothetical protein